MGVDTTLVPILTGRGEELEAAENRAATAEAERDLLAVELARIADSQSQFEMYEDKSGKFRFRLRHRNGNILADSGQGYAERSSAEDGLLRVKRNAPNADVEAAE
ncbi:MAG: YegP family protein [Halovenus sp.]